jgi:hypothetical protein
MNNSGATGIHEDDSVVAGDTSSYSAGAVRIYTASNDGWTQQALVKASNTGLNDQFGSAVAISGDGNTLAVSAPFEDSGSTGINGDGTDNSISQSGAVYLFTRNGDAWSQAAYVKASNTGDSEDGDTFGYSISLSDDGSTLAVGATSEDSASALIDGDQSDDSAMASGAVYVFVRSGEDWTQQAYIKTSNNTAGVLFGYSVALDDDGNTLVASAYDEEGGRGAVYLFTLSEGGWSEEVRLQASNIEGQDSMGVWLNISDDGKTVAVGSPDEDSFLTGVAPADQAANDQVTNTSAGAVYIFARNEGTWRQQAFIKASNTGLEDWFGFRLALSGDGDTLAAAAPNEDGGGQGTGGNQNDDSASEAGAVYIYRRSGVTWNNEAYIKGSNTGQFDEFGSAVALSREGAAMVVGARFEDGEAGDGPGEITDSGAVYVFSP